MARKKREPGLAKDPRPTKTGPRQRIICNEPLDDGKFCTLMVGHTTKHAG